MLMISKLMIPFALLLVPLYFMMVTFRLIDNLLAVILPAMVGAFDTFLMRQTISQIPDDLIDAARIDELSEFGIFVRIILPLIKPALATLAIYEFMVSWNDFLWPLTVLNSPENFLMTVALSYFQGQFFVEYGPIMAASTIFVIPTIVVFLALQRQFIESIIMSGLNDSFAKRISLTEDCLPHPLARLSLKKLFVSKNGL